MLVPQNFNGKKKKNLGIDEKTQFLLLVYYATVIRLANTNLTQVETSNGHLKRSLNKPQRRRHIERLYVISRRDGH